MPDPVPLGEAIRGLLEADHAVSAHGLTGETRTAFLGAWDTALDAVERCDDERPAGFSPDVADTAWATREDGPAWTLTDGLNELHGYSEQPPFDLDAFYAELRRIEESKPIIICAEVDRDRISGRLQQAGLDQHYRVQAHPWLDAGTSYVVDPRMLRVDYPTPGEMGDEPDSHRWIDESNNPGQPTAPDQG